MMRFILTFITMIVIYSLFNVLIARSLVLWLSVMLPGIMARPVYLIYTLFAISPLLLFLVPSRSIWRKGVSQFAFHWMGIYLYLFLLVTLAVVILGVAFKLGGIGENTGSRVILVTGWLIVAAVAAVLTYGRIHAKNLQVKTYQITVDKALGPDGLTVALISDLHLGMVNGADHMQQMVDKVNAMNPDLVCIAGDIFDGDFYAVKEPEVIVSLLDSIQSRYGTYACLGNHDAGKSYQQMIEMLEQTSIKVLNDEYLVVDNRFVIAGRRDSSPIGGHGAPRAELSGLADAAPGLPVIVMDHQPSNIVEYGTETDLVVCGHTHRGQMFPGPLVTNRIFDVDYGWYQRDNQSPQVIVTSGAGTWGPPFRIGTDSEVVKIEIQAAES